jgi:hypothetical protein
VLSNFFERGAHLANSCEIVVEMDANDPDPFVAQGTRQRSNDPQSGISPEEWADGVRWKGLIEFRYYRLRARYRADGVWLPWDDWRYRPKLDPELPVRVATLIEKNERWFASDLRMTGPWLSTITVPNAIPKAAPAQLLFEGWDFQHPPPTLKQLLFDIDQPSCEDIFSNRRTRKEPLKPLKNRQFTGTPQGFIAAFPELLKQATDALGVEEKDYEPEKISIINAVRTCGQITPEMMASVNRGMFSSPDLGKLGGQYDICISNGLISNGQDSNSKELALGIGLMINPVWVKDHPDEDGFRVTADFRRLEDGGIPSNLRDTVIATGMIYSSPLVAKQLTSTMPLQALPNRKFQGTSDQFISALPEFLERAFKAMSLDANNYTRETAFINKSIQKCAQITPQLVQSTIYKGSFGQPNIKRLGDDYKMCSSILMFNVSDEVKKNYNKDVERGDPKPENCTSWK